jgi:hypothetical protein
MGPAFSRLRVGDGVLQVRMGWAFGASVPLSVIKAAFRRKNAWGGVGVHGWKGRWLVNGSVAGIVRICIDPETRARMSGFTVRLHTLDVSVEDPDGLIAAITGATARH